LSARAGAMSNITLLRADALSVSSAANSPAGHNAVSSVMINTGSKFFDGVMHLLLRHKLRGKCQHIKQLRIVLLVTEFTEALKYYSRSKAAW